MKEYTSTGLKAKLPKIECFPSQFRDYEITHIIPEFTSLCPKTGLPDFGTITIKYIPDKLCIELKSLKLYIGAYRNLGIFYENSVNQILKDIIKASKPIKAEITGEFNPRGGIKSVVRATYPDKKILPILQ